MNTSNQKAEGHRIACIIAYMGHWVNHHSCRLTPFQKAYKMVAWTQEREIARVVLAPFERVVYGSRKALVSTVATLSKGVSLLTASRGQTGFYRLIHSVETTGALREQAPLICIGTRPGLHPMDQVRLSGSDPAYDCPVIPGAGNPTIQHIGLCLCIENSRENTTPKHIGNDIGQEHRLTRYVKRKQKRVSRAKNLLNPALDFVRFIFVEFPTALIETIFVDCPPQFARRQGGRV